MSTMEEEQKADGLVQPEQHNSVQLDSPELPVQQAANVINEKTSQPFTQGERIIRQGDGASQKPERRNKIIPVLLAAAIILALIGAVSFALYGTDNVANTKVGECLTTDGTEHCLSIDKTEVSYSDSFTLKSFITNKGNGTLLKSFPCVSNNPSVTVNGGTLGSGMCLTAISNVSIEPGETVYYAMPMSASVLREGTNEIFAEWAGYKSGTVSINLVVNNDDASKN